MTQIETKKLCGVSRPKKFKLKKKQKKTKKKESKSKSKLNKLKNRGYTRNERKQTSRCSHLM